MSNSENQRNKASGYKDGLSGQKPSGLFDMFADPDYLAGKGEGYGDYLQNKDLASRLTKVATKVAEKTSENTATINETIVINEKDPDAERRHRENVQGEERRHRELLEALKKQAHDTDDPEDDNEETEEEGGDSSAEPNMFYSKKTRRLFGLGWLRKIIEAVNDDKEIIWRVVNIPVRIGAPEPHLEGYFSNGRNRIRIYINWYARPLEYKTFSEKHWDKIILLEDFNVIISYEPISDEERGVGAQFINSICDLMRKEGKK